MIRRCRLLLAAAALSAALPALPAFAGDNDKPPAGASDEASARFRAGVAFYRDHDYAAALVEFKRAYEINPNYKVLYNLGQTSQELNDYASALAAFRQYLAEGGTNIDKLRRTEVNGYIDTLTKKVGSVTLETNVEGAEVFVDDLSVGKVPLANAVLVNAGRRKFSATLSGYQPVVRQEEIAGRDEVTIKLELVKIEKDEPPPRPVPVAPQANGYTIPVGVWVLLGFTAAAGITTGVMGALAVDARGELDQALSAFPGNQTAIEDAQTKVQTYAIATDVGIGVTAAAGVGTLVWFLVAQGASGDEEPAATAEATFQVTPGGFVVRGTF
ncbi:MAG: PEGA domain-containing protein [Polyangiaceae bacterium]|nr:PEGA domain-containing protein [Polyangiaceae bacterium]